MNTPQQPQKAPQEGRGKDLGGLYHGLQFAITAMAGLAAGYWLDQRVLPPPLGTLGGLLAGSALGMYILVRSMK